MATYSNNTPTMTNGDATTFPYFANDFYTDGTSKSYLRFTGATAVLAGTTINSATLTLGNLGGPLPTNESFYVWAELAANAALPVDDTDASSRSYTTAVADSGNLNGLSTAVIDVKAVLQELISAINGDVIHLRVSDPTYDGTGIGPGVTALLEITYDVITARPTQLMQCCC